jgi:hypothetical protein
MSTYTNLKEFIVIVRKLADNHGVLVTTDNDNNTVVAHHKGKTVAQWFSNSGFIDDDYVALANQPKKEAK